MNESGATSASFEGMPFGNISKRGLEAASQGFDLYTKTMKSLFGIVLPSQKDDQEDILKAWSNAAFGNKNKIVDVFVNALKAFGSPIPDGFKWAEDVTNTWKNMSKGEIPLPSLQQSREASDALLKNWIKNSETFFIDMQDCLKQFMNTQQSVMLKGNDPQQIYKVCIDSSEECYNAIVRARHSFTVEQSKAYFEFLNSFLPENQEVRSKTDDMPGKKKKEKMR